MRVRPPAVAGRFYPAAAADLGAAVDRLLAAAGPPDGPLPAALVVPHAGYVYSGPVAATAYAALRGRCAQVERVVLLGPAHFTRTSGMVAAAAERWATPLGEVPVVPAPGLPADDRPHAREHSLEVQLPFLQRLLGAGFGVLPVAVGDTAPEQVADWLDAVWDGPGTLVVVSTDLSHYYDLATARRRDRRTADAVLARDVAAIGPDAACGRDALRGLLAYASRHGAEVRLLDLRTSADTAGDPARVVGYGAFALAG